MTFNEMLHMFLDILYCEMDLSMRFRVEGSGFRVKGSGFRVWGIGRIMRL